MEVWNELGGLDWAGIPLVLARHGLEHRGSDVIAGLIVIRNHLQDRSHRNG